jgi:muconolactone delta-isomerase
MFIIEASSNEELDEVLRNIPMWGSINWEVTPLTSFEARAAQERRVFNERKWA